MILTRFCETKANQIKINVKSFRTEPSLSLSKGSVLPTYSSFALVGHSLGSKFEALQAKSF
jgi:hypothetical protein